jgi:hypothetical protein
MIEPSLEVQYEENSDAKPKILQKYVMGSKIGEGRAQCASRRRVSLSAAPVDESRRGAIVHMRDRSFRL